MKQNRIIAVSLVMILMLGLTGCQKQIPIEDMGRLVEFNYSFGSFLGGDWSYKIYKKSGKTYLLGEGSNGVELKGESVVSENVSGDIEKIIKDNDIVKWNGFSKSDDDILDGYSFSIKAIYENGTIEASGYMKFPSNYDAAHKALSTYLEKLSKEAGLS